MACPQAKIRNAKPEPNSSKNSAGLLCQERVPVEHSAVSEMKEALRSRLVGAGFNNRKLLQSKKAAMLTVAVKRHEIHTSCMDYRDEQTKRMTQLKDDGRQPSDRVERSLSASAVVARRQRKAGTSRVN